jgi:tRNA(Arg) A34 adenosine deaminase TadA
MVPAIIELTTPAWLPEELQTLPQRLETREARMRAVIRCSRLNIAHDTGGPFAAGVFERDTGRLVTLGVNRVVANRCSSAHAEVMALSQAQHLLGTHDLGAPGLPDFELVVNWRPCAMCYGAVLWSGVRSLVVAGDGPELEAITGFDEGPMREDWADQLEKRGIGVTNHVLGAEACEVFREFRTAGRTVYNARGGSTSCKPGRS